MRILITGVNGFVGQTLYRHLSLEHDVLGIYHSNKKEFENCFKVDLTSEKETESFFKSQRNIDVIVHLASKRAAADNLNDISLLTVNSNIAKHVALGAKYISVGSLINLSSSSVYPNVDGVFDESVIPDPSPNADCIYGLSKYNSEVVFNYFLHTSSIKIAHLRCSMIHGSGMDEKHLLHVLEKELEQNNSITLFGNGERLINIISVHQLVEYITFFVKNPYHGIVNVSEECISVLDYGKKIIGRYPAGQKKLVLKAEGNKNKFRLDFKKLQILIKSSE